ncbi:hypothetical protein OIU77_016255 [Salix suchowensis]|uniref:RIN4 pathogenic type III effector avirulence factor Avr cleavage site domain-containing protein n=1 Tax=Salix suchowensis TaxID=1278906 RepID=A0ABQ8ZJZ2_9ROSI|nr:hypothetical protein OIU77_016255 [Salix suchowensis]
MSSKMVVKEIVVINACNRLWLKQRALASSKSKSDVTPCMLIVIYIIFCEQQDQGRPLPKFGEWDVNNPASAEGFTVIFSKARDEKKSGTASGAGAASQRKTNSSQANSQYPPPKKWVGRDSELKRLNFIRKAVNEQPEMSDLLKQETVLREILSEDTDAACDTVDRFDCEVKDSKL